MQSEIVIHLKASRCNRCFTLAVPTVDMHLKRLLTILAIVAAAFVKCTIIPQTYCLNTIIAMRGRKDMNKEP